MNFHCAHPRCIRSSAVFTDGQSKRTSLPGVLIYGSLPLRRQFWMVPGEQFKRRESSSVSMNPSGSTSGGAGSFGSSVSVSGVVTSLCFMALIMRHYAKGKYLQ